MLIEMWQVGWSLWVDWHEDEIYSTYWFRRQQIFSKSFM